MPSCGTVHKYPMDIDKNTTSRVKFIQWTWTSTHHIGYVKPKIKYINKILMYCHHLPLHYNWKPHQLRHKKLYQHLQCHHLYLDLWQCWSRRRTVCLYRMDSHTTTHCAAVFPVRNIRIMRLFKNIKWIWTRTQQAGLNLSNRHGRVHITPGT